MTHNDSPISPLRARMLDDMTLRKLGPKTQAGYVRAVSNLAKFLGRSPDIANAEDLRRFQLDMAQRGVSRTTINAHISGLRFFFEVTLDRPEVMKKMKALPVERKLPVILSVEEVGVLLRHAPNLKARAALSGTSCSKPPPRPSWRSAPTPGISALSSASPRCYTAGARPSPTIPTCTASSPVVDSPSMDSAGCASSARSSSSPCASSPYASGA